MGDGKQSPSPSFSFAGCGNDRCAEGITERCAKAWEYQRKKVCSCSRMGDGKQLGDTGEGIRKAQLSAVQKLGFNREKSLLMLKDERRKNSRPAPLFPCWLR